MSKIYETTIELNAALGRHYAQTFAAAQKLTNGLDSELVEMQRNAANMSGLAALGEDIQKLTADMAKAGGGTEDQKNKLKYLSNEYADLSVKLNGTVVAYSNVAENASKLTDAFEAQEIAAKNLEQTQQALTDVEGVIAQRKEVEHLKDLYEKMPNKQLEKDIKEQEKALKKLESQTGLTGRSMEQLKNRQNLLIANNKKIVINNELEIASQQKLQKQIAKKEAWTKFTANAGKAFKVFKVGALAVVGAVVAIGAAVAKASQMLISITNEASDKLFDIEKRSRQFGMDSGVLQGMSYSFQKAGLEQDQFMDGMQTLQERMTEALADPAGEMTKNFKKVGVSLDDLKNNDVGAIAKMVAGNIHMIGSEAEQTKFGLDMLGGEGGQMIATMAKNGIAGMEKDIAEAKKLGIVATEEQIQQAQEYKKSMMKIQAQWDGVKMKIATGVMPALTSLMDRFSAWLEENPDGIQNIIDMIVDGVKSISGFILNDLIPAVKDIINFFREWKDVFVFIGLIAKAAFDMIVSNFTLFPKIVMSVISYIREHWQGFIDGIVETWKSGVKLVSSAFSTAIDWIKETWQSGVDLVSSGIDWLVSAFLSIPDKISSIGNTISSFFTDLWGGIKQTFIDMMNWVISKINSVSIEIPEFVPKYGGSTIGFDIPMLANGGIATKATPAIIGEGAEPEAVLPLSKLKSLMGGSMGGVSLTITQNISLNGDNSVESQAKRGAAAGAQDLAAQIDAIMKRKYRLAM